MSDMAEVIQMDAFIRTASQWWANKLCSKEPHRNGTDSEASRKACALADRLRRPVTVGQCIGFMDALDLEIRQAIGGGKHTLVLSCDYAPDERLKNAAKKAGISEFNFPYKTNMWIDLADGKIFVSEGNNVPYIELKVDIPECQSIPHHGNNMLR